MEYYRVHTSVLSLGMGFVCLLVCLFYYYLAQKGIAFKFHCMAKMSKKQKQNKQPKETQNTQNLTLYCEYWANLHTTGFHRNMHILDVSMETPDVGTFLCCFVSEAKND